MQTFAILELTDGSEPEAVPAENSESIVPATLSKALWRFNQANDTVVRGQPAKGKSILQWARGALVKSLAAF